MTERQGRDEGALQTRRIVDAVRRLRNAKGWSAQQLAEEMTKAGVPWNADVVVNLEHGRRKSLRVHELLALLFVLDVDRPLEVIVPGEDLFPVVPAATANPDNVRAWLRGDAKPLRLWLAEDLDGRSTIERAAGIFEEQGKGELAAQLRKLAVLLDVPGDGADGQD